MSYENKGTVRPTVIVTSDADGTGNMIFRAGVDDPAVTIEAAWTHLAQFGGGVLVTKGAGETWVAQTPIDSQGDNVTWVSDWSLCIQGIANLDDSVIYITHDWVTLIGIYVDGNGPNQTQPTTTAHCIEAFEADYLIVERCKTYNAESFGININGSNRPEIVDCVAYECGANGIQITQTGAGEGGLISDCKAWECSDVGIGVYDGKSCKVVDCEVWNIDNNESPFALNTHWGYNVESTSNNNVFSNCNAYDCPGAGLFATTTNGGQGLLIDGCYFETVGYGIYCGQIDRIRIDGCTVQTFADVGIYVGATSVQVSISDCEVYDSTGSGDHGIEVSTARAKINDCRVENVTGHGIYVNAADGTSVIGCTVYNVNTNYVHAILLESGTDNCVINDNIIIDCVQRGIQLNGTCDNNVISGNRVTGCQIGIIITAGTCDKNIVTSNQLLGNATALTDSGTATEVAHNIVA